MRELIFFFLSINEHFSIHLEISSSKTCLRRLIYLGKLLFKKFIGIVSLPESLPGDLILDFDTTFNEKKIIGPAPGIKHCEGGDGRRNQI